MGNLWETVDKTIAAVRTIHFTEVQAYEIVNSALVGCRLPILQDWKREIREATMRATMEYYREDDDMLRQAIRALMARGVDVSLARIQRWCVTWCFWGALSLDPEQLLS